nr:hypothetical protein OG781_03970 [Streptomyces sp. NBC_00830]
MRDMVAGEDRVGGVAEASDDTQGGTGEKSGCEVSVGSETFFDVIEFPPPDPDDEEEEFGRLITSADHALGALAAAEDSTGAVRERWVNESVTQDEYRDFVRAGRPTDASPDGHPWPALPAGH